MLLLCRTCSEYDDVYEEAGEEEEARDEEGEEGDDNVIDIDRPEDGSAGHAVAVEDRMTTPYMTKYERARILGTRALQIRCADRLGSRRQRTRLALVLFSVPAQRLPQRSARADALLCPYHAPPVAA